MPNLDSAFGIHELALRLQAKRTEVLASNLANADTPNYKARDIDFESILREAKGAGGPEALRTTHANHFGSAGTVGGGVFGFELLYRNPHQASLDGNTVDAQVEKAQFMENALRYQASLSFIDGTIKKLRKALKGE